MLSVFDFSEPSDSKGDFVYKSAFSNSSAVRETTEPHLFGKDVLPVESGSRSKKIVVLVVLLVAVLAALTAIVVFVVTNKSSDDGPGGGVWTVWTEWRDCSSTCGGGVRNRTRTCQGADAQCAGEASDQRACNTQDCPRSIWGPWGSWSACDVTCGQGTETRNRQCQKPEGSSSECVGESQETVSCGVTECPGSIWGPWGSWSACDVTCGQGTETRYRQCQKPEGSSIECVGESQETVSCGVTECPGSIWGPWGSWSACDVTCGQGTGTRNRQCQKPEDSSIECVGESQETVSCGVIECPVVVWSVWGSWSSCDVTCGQGIQTRYRQCERASNASGQCVGDSRELSLCNTADCEVYGTWTSWTSWGSCNVSCGGGIQTRTRICQKESTSDADCAGEATMKQSCSSWGCPDCSTQCSTGVLNDACDTCTCDGNSVTVRTLTTSNKPLMDVYAYAASAPTTLLATSDGGGSLTLTTLCLGAEIILTKEGFLDTNVVLASSSVQANMKQIVYPRIETSPVSKYRLPGGDAKFCCVAVADPDVTYYEWFKDGILLASSLYPKQTELDVINVSIPDSGRYRCRANSPVGAVYSQEAILSVKETPNDFCLNALEDRVISLPRDCVQPETNASTYNVGTCKPSPCRNKPLDTESSCTDTDYSCCRPSAYIFVTVQCSGYELSLSIVQSCACASCTLPSLTISGVASGGTTALPLKRGQVFANGNFRTYTSTSGSFSLSVPASPDSQSVTLKFVDVFYDTFYDMVKVITIPQASTDNIYISVKMIEKPDPIILQSGLENTLYGGGDNATNSASAVTEITIPSDSYYYPNGSKYDGSVSVIFTYLLPSDAQGFEAIPGEFQFVDGDGERSQLETLGVFNLQLFDGNNQELTVSEPIDVTLSGSSDGIDPDTGEAMQLWGLNDNTGYWELLPFIQAKRRKRRQGYFLIGQVNTGDYRWRNCDIYWNARPCYVNPPVYNDESLTTLVDDTNFKLTYLYTRDVSSRFRSARWTTYTYTGPACTAIKCSRTLANLQLEIATTSGYSTLFATEPGPTSTHTTDEDARAVKITMVADDLNIFLTKSDCEAQVFSSDGLLFYSKAFAEDIYTFNWFQDDLIITDDIATLNMFDWKSWCRNTAEGQIYKQTKACALKVAVTSRRTPFSSLRVVVHSRMGRATEYEGDIVGIREAIPDSSGYACVSYRCTTTIERELDETDTSISVWTPRGSCKVLMQNPGLVDVSDQTGNMKMNLKVKSTYEEAGSNGFYKADHQRFEHIDHDCRNIAENVKTAYCDIGSEYVASFQCD